MTQLTDIWQPFVAAKELDPALREVMVVLRDGYKPLPALSEKEFDCSVREISQKLEPLAQRWQNKGFEQALAPKKPIGQSRLPEMSPNCPLMVAIDLDGTVVNPIGEVAERSRAAIAALKKQGVAVVIATGRSVSMTSPVAELLDLTSSAAVCSNGAIGGIFSKTPEGLPLFTPEFIHTFDPTPVVGHIQTLLPNALLAVEDAPQGFRATDRFPNGELQEISELVTVDELCEYPVCRLVVRDPNMSLDDFTHVLQKANLQAVEFSIGWTSWVDISPPGINKATGLAELAAAWGIPRSNVIAIGDGDNDADMLEWAGLGVAMSNANEKLLDLSDMQIPRVERDGVGAFMNALLEHLPHERRKFDQSV